MREAGFGELVREALLDAWALIQPIECLGCGTEDRALCRACRAALAPPPTGIEIACDAAPWFPVVCAADYAGEVRSAIVALKSHGRLDAASALAGHTRCAVNAAIASTARDPRTLRLTWVPSTPRALRRRGYDPVAELVTRARLQRWRTLAARGAGEQKRRVRAERMAASTSEGRYRARRRLDGDAFVIVDDIATTGATLVAAARAIERAGGHVVAAAVIAAPDLARRRRAGSAATGSRASRAPGEGPSGIEAIRIRLPENFS